MLSASRHVLQYRQLTQHTLLPKLAAATRSNRVQSSTFRSPSPSPEQQPEPSVFYMTERGGPAKLLLHSSRELESTSTQASTRPDFRRTSSAETGPARDGRSPSEPQYSTLWASTT